MIRYNYFVTYDSKGQNARHSLEQIMNGEQVQYRRKKFPQFQIKNNWLFGCIMTLYQHAT
jgi:hypothetical protein